MQTLEVADMASLPRLAANLTGCVRWQWRDLEEMIERQLEIIDDAENDDRPRGESDT